MPIPDPRNKDGNDITCSACGGRRSRVVDTRADPEGHFLRRRRECQSCLTRFTTYEVNGNYEKTVRELRERMAALGRQLAAISELLDQIPEAPTDGSGADSKG